MPSYRRLRLLAATLLALLFIVGMASEFPPRHEVFPLASWFLFVLVPNHVVEYDVEFRAVDDQPLASAVRFSRAAGYVNMPHSITAFQTIQALGQALDHHDSLQPRTLRQQIDAYCGPARLRYDVVAVTYDPVARYDTGAVLQRRLLGSFVAREP